MKLADSGINSAGFGRGLALSDDGSFAVVGATDVDVDGDGTREGRAYVYDATGGWSGVTSAAGTVGERGDGSAGSGVAMSADGTTAFVGDPQDSIEGSRVGKVAVMYAHL